MPATGSGHGGSAGSALQGLTRRLLLEPDQTRPLQRGQELGQASLLVDRDLRPGDIELQELIHPDHGLAYLSRRLGHDVTGYDPDKPVPNLEAVDEVGTRSGQMLDMARQKNWTLRQLYQHFAATRGHMVLVGTPVEVVDSMQEWFENGACDGFNLIPPTFPGEFDAFVDMVVPELQNRGIYRTAYEGTTLRDRLELSVPESRYAAGAAAAE